jgi:hypothetical protein
MVRRGYFFSFVVWMQNMVEDELSSVYKEGRIDPADRSFTFMINREIH